MRIISATCGNNYCGCDSEEVFFFDDGTLDSVIDSEIYSWAVENAESFSYVHLGWDSDYSEEDYKFYIENYVDFDWHDATYEEYVEWCENYGYTPKLLDSFR